MSHGPTASITSDTTPAKPAMAMSVTFTLRRKGSAPSPVTHRRVRWGRIEVCTAWKSTSGARARSSTLNTKPARAAPCSPSVARTSSGPAFRKVCSASMIASTASANPVPRERVNSGSRGAAASLSISAGSAGAAGAGAILRVRAMGTTTSESSGAAAIPSATAACPFAIPTVTASANRKRERDSMRTRPPYSS